MAAAFKRLDMPKVVGGIAAFAALAAGILGEVDATVCLTRAALAFLLGWVAAQVWNVMLMGSGLSARRFLLPEGPSKGQSEDPT
jgi:hypothetical protein